MATVLSSVPQSHAASLAAGLPIQVRAPHGTITVIARYDARSGWNYEIPSRSQRGATWSMTSTHCTCPAHKANCWHMKLLPAIEEEVRWLLSETIAHDLCPSASFDERTSGLRFLARLGLDEVAARGQQTTLLAKFYQRMNIKAVK